MVRCACLGRQGLQKLFSSFPEGWPGIGLILLRLAVAFEVTVRALGTLTETHVPMASLVTGLLEILIGVALLLGCLTPFAGAFAVLDQLIIGISCGLSGCAVVQDRALLAIDLVMMSLTLVLLGPGAFSLDAYLFGRREIIIPDSSGRPEL